MFLDQNDISMKALISRGKQRASSEPSILARVLAVPIYAYRNRKVRQYCCV